jgi:NAD(P)-dependent dehydrogenase (short-subunit alcohol dehydrogenase family)
MKHILITGGTGGLGKTVVQTLSQKGYYLHLAVRGDEKPSIENTFNYSVDLIDAQASEKMAERLISQYHHLEAAVFMAGGYMPGGILQVSIEDIHKMISLNFDTAYTLARILVRHFRNAGKGKLVFIGAKAAVVPDLAAGNLAYSLSKQLLLQLTQLINEGEKEFGTRAHILLPGTMDTPANRQAMPEADFSKWTSPEAIASTIADILEGKDLEPVVSF